MTSLWVVTLTTLIVIAADVAHGDVSITRPEGRTMTASVGESIMFQCVNSNGKEVEWVFQAPFGDMVISDIPPYTLTSASNTAGYTLLLSIDDVTEDDAGTFICRAKDDSGDDATVDLLVAEDGAAPPDDFVVPTINLRDGQSSIEVEAGKELRLKCVGGETSNLQFHHNGKAITEDTHNFVTAAKDISTNAQTLILSREPAKAEYSGTYTCFDAAFPDQTTPVEVTVVDHPSTDVELVEPSGKQTKVMLGDNFYLKCQSSMNTEINWYQDDEQLQDEVGGFLIQISADVQTRVRTTVLVKEGAEARDSGTYRCENADSPDKEDSIVLSVKEQGDDGSILDAFFGGATCMTCSTLLVLLAAICLLI